VVSETARLEPDPGVAAGIEAHAGEMAIASLVLHELRFGCERLPKSRRRKLLEGWLAEVVAPALPVLPYDGAAAAWHARERARLAKAGRTPPFVDGQIAAIAATNDLVLVTANPKDFKGYRGLEVADWTAGKR